MLLMGNLDKLLVLLMLLLGMDLYIDLDLEQHSIGLAYDLYLEGTLDEVVVGKLGREGMLDKGGVDKRIVLMDKLLLLGMEQLVLLSLLMLLVLDLLLLLGFDLDLDLNLDHPELDHAHQALHPEHLEHLEQLQEPKLEKLQANLDLGLYIVLELLLELSLHL